MTAPAEHRNLFNALRIIAAALVFYSHSYALGNLQEPWLLGVMSFGGLGVAIFFSISGYLVTLSLNRDHSILHFFAKRALRIFPALIAVAIIWAYIFGPAFTQIDRNQYLLSQRTFSYVYKNIGLFPQFDLPGLFASNPNHGVNGSLWTLPLECSLYIVVSILFIARSRQIQAMISLAFFVLTAYLNYVVPAGKYIYYGSDLYQIAFHAPYFFFGSWLASQREWVQQRGAKAVLPLAIAMVALIGTPLLKVSAWIVLPTISIAIGEIKLIRSTWVEYFGDISYGIYLWSFPFQQMAILYLMPKTGLFFAMFIAAIAVIISAILSWRYIEKPSLSFKRKLQQAD